MRIGIVTPGFPATPADPFAPYWAERVRGLAIRHEVEVFPLRFPYSRAPYALHGARVTPLASRPVPLRRSPRLWLDALAALAQAHRRRPFDLLVSLHGAESGFVAALAGTRLRLPLAVHLGGGELASLPRLGYGSQGVPWERAQLALALRRARVVTVGSRRLQWRARQVLRTRRTAVKWAPFGVDTTRFRPAPWPSTPRLLHVADMNPVKGQPVLLEAFGAVLAQQPAARLDLVGGGRELLGIRRLSRALAVDQAIRWRGQIPHDAMPLLYHGAAAFILSSWYEAQGVVLAEAAAAGLPIAATRVGMALDLPAAGVHLAAVGNAEALASAMLAALATGERDRARTDLRHSAASLYGTEVCNLRIEAILRRAAAPS